LSCHKSFAKDGITCFDGKTVFNAVKHGKELLRREVVGIVVMSDKPTLAVRVDDDSEVYEEFEEYKRRGGHASTSEALRDIMRAQLIEEQRSEPKGLLAAVMSVAGDELGLQFRSLGWYMIFTAGMLWAFQSGLIGGAVWLGAAALFGFLSVVTLVFGIGAGLVDQLDPTPTTRGDSNTSGDEVEQ
jgi:hypothetical protein